MRRLLFLAYHFPPMGGAGTQRSAKFVRDLPSLGYTPIVVTGPGQTVGIWTPTDETLAEEIPAEAVVHRVPGAVPDGDGRRAAIARWADVPSPFARWWTGGAIDAGRQAAAAAGGVDAVYGSMSPYETAHGAATLARELGCPWIADLRDPWALDEMRRYPSALHARRDRSRMRAVLGHADTIIMNTPEAAHRLERRFPELGAKPIVSIPNGWDAGDFAGAAPACADRAFRIVHTGSLHTDTGQRHRREGRGRRLLGGAAEVDVLTRSHVHLLEAIRRLRLRRPELGCAVEVHLAGNLTEADLRAADVTGVQVHGYLPHAESVRLLRSADLLFLPMHDLPKGVRATIVPGKTYEYLAAGRPILAALPEGDARDLLAPLDGVTVCAPGDVDAMVSAIAGAAGRKRAKGPALVREAPLLARFERRRLSGELAEALDGLLGGAERAAKPRLSLVS